MAKLSYTQRLRNAGASCLMSTTCRWCYNSGVINSFFGVPITGVLNGTHPQDLEFEKKIWKAAQKHIKDVHGRTVVRNGAGGWKIVKISD